MYDYHKGGNLPQLEYRNGGLRLVLWDIVEPFRSFEISDKMVHVQDDRK